METGELLELSPDITCMMGDAESDVPGIVQEGTRDVVGEIVARELLFHLDEHFWDSVMYLWIGDLTKGHSEL